jgi:hypothetical protein
MNSRSYTGRTILTHQLADKARYRQLAQLGDKALHNSEETKTPNFNTFPIFRESLCPQINKATMSNAQAVFLTLPLVYDLKYERLLRCQVLHKVPPMPVGIIRLLDTHIFNNVPVLMSKDHESVSNHIPTLQGPGIQHGKRVFLHYSQWMLNI